MELDKETIQSLYNRLKKVKLVAEQLGVSQECIRKRMIKFGIDRDKGREPKLSIDGDTLRSEYQSMTMREIAEKYGVGETTIWAALKAHGIKHSEFGKYGHRHRKREFSQEHRRKMSEARKGKSGAAANGNWKGGISFVHLTLRRSIDYKNWRRDALELRGMSCQECGAVEASTCECCGHKVKLHVHHVKSFAKFPEHRFDPSNSEVLCPKCHQKRHHRITG